MLRRRRRAGQGLAGDPFALLLLLQLGQQLMRALGVTGAVDNDDHRRRRNPNPIPIATLALAAAMLASYFAPELADAGLIPETLAATLAPPLDDVCLQPRLVLEGGQDTASSLLRRVLGGGAPSSPSTRQWTRLIASAFTHADLSHLVYNLSSLLFKGTLLEKRIGSLPFLALFAELLLLSHGLFCGAAFVLGRWLPSQAWSRPLIPFTRFITRDIGWPMYAHTCAVGCSAVLFALKVVVQAEDQRGQAVVAWGPFAGLRVPARHASWVELILASAVNPRASFSGHLCGILAGLLHVKVLGPALRQRRGRGWGWGFGGGVGRRLAGGGDGARAPARRPQQQQQQDQQQQPAMTAEELRRARLRRLGG
jgi:membrane associated rhomboid family serine protease